MHARIPEAMIGAPFDPADLEAALAWSHRMWPRVLRVDVELDHAAFPECLAVYTTHGGAADASYRCYPPADDAGGIMVEPQAGARGGRFPDIAAALDWIAGGLGTLRPG